MLMLRECYGMTGSPLGKDVTWFHISSAAYGGMQSDWGREAFKRDFRLEILRSGKWELLRKIENNRKRYLRLNFVPVEASGIRLIPERSWDPAADRVHLFSFEVE